jgi:hypothetical protein
VDAIFPSDDSVLRDAAWFTYVVSCPVYDNVFDVLRQHYSEAVDRLADQPEHDPRWGRRVGERLGRHLMAMVGRGKLHWGDDHGVLKRFFDGATSLDASGAISSVGHSLLNAKGNVPSEVVGCFRTFWSEFSSAMLKEGGDRTKLLLPFGWWFASGRFDDEWSLAELKRVVEVAHAIDPDFMVMERLAELSSEFPQQALSVFQALVQGDKDGLYVLDWKDCARRVLEAALRFESSRDEALALIHELGVHGHLQFRSLLPK